MFAEHILRIIGIGAAVLTACAPVGAPEDEVAGDSESPSREQSVLLTNELQWQNGLFENGLFENGLGVTGISTSAGSAGEISLDGAELVVAGSMYGEDVIDFELTIHLEDGTTSTILIVDAVPSPSDPELWFYQLADPRGDPSQSACGNDSHGEPLLAIALAGRWDYSAGTATGGDWIDDSTQFTFACMGSVLAKCVTIGYKPWQTFNDCDGFGNCEARSLGHHHQACTRMLRADYCGDGQPHTVNGVPLNVWDDIPIQEPGEVDFGWAQDAEWSAEGAVCIQNLRVDPDGAASSYVATHCPERQTATFACFGEQSTFFAENSSATPIEQRSLLRNQFDAVYVSELP
jgi:hypothetical protein